MVIPEFYAVNRRYVEKEVETRMQELQMRKGTLGAGNVSAGEDSRRRREGVTGSDGRRIEGSHQRPQSGSGNRLEGNRWDTTVPREYENSRQGRVREEGREPWPMKVRHTEGGQGVGWLGEDVRAGQEAWRLGIAGGWVQPGSRRTRAGSRTRRCQGSENTRNRSGPTGVGGAAGEATRGTDLLTTRERIERLEEFGGTRSGTAGGASRVGIWRRLRWVSTKGPETRAR